jgi:SAM-dependent methyltransferase
MATFTLCTFGVLKRLNRGQRCRLTSFEAQYYEADSFWADGALSDAHNSQRFEKTCSLIAADVGSILDVGCGNGEFLRIVRKLRPDIVLRGLDRSKTALKYLDAEAIEGNVDAIPLPNESADCVTCLQVIEHLPCNIYNTALQELARSARKYVIIGVPYAEDLRTDIAQCPQCYTVFNLNLHMRTFDLQTLTHLFTNHGFELTSHMFPCPTTAYWGTQSLAKRRNNVVKRNRVDFISPICPVCGYTAGDITKISRVSKANTERYQFLFRLGTRVLKGLMRRVWPTVQLEGYWLVALYKKRAQA